MMFYLMQSIEGLWKVIPQVEEVANIDFKHIKTNIFFIATHLITNC